MTRVAIIIPFRDRGLDPLRQANLENVLWHWDLYRAPVIVTDDGRTGNSPFCRSATYNKGAAQTDADILIYTEADMLIHYDQIDKAVALAAEQPGLIVPFTRQKKLSPRESEQVRAGIAPIHFDCPLSQPKPDHGDGNCPTCGFLFSTACRRLVGGEPDNYGCINVISRETLNAIGKWDELFEGNAHDDCAMWHAFNIAAGPTRFVQGDAYHLYHTESVGPDTSPEDKAATERNYRRMQTYMQARTPEEIRHLTAGGQNLSRNWRGQLR